MSDAEPAAGWPGLTGYGQGFAVDPAVLDAMAATLLRECDSIRHEFGRGSLQHLHDSAGPLAAASKGEVFGYWTAGRSLHRMHAELHSYVARFYADLVARLEFAAKGLEAAADQYRAASERTEAGTAQIDPSAPAPTGLPPSDTLPSGDGGAVDTSPDGSSTPAAPAPLAGSASTVAAPPTAPSPGPTDFENVH